MSATLIPASLQRRLTRSSSCCSCYCQSSGSTTTRPKTSPLMKPWLDFAVVLVHYLYLNRGVMIWLAQFALARIVVPLKRWDGYHGNFSKTIIFMQVHLSYLNTTLVSTMNTSQMIDHGLSQTTDFSIFWKTGWLKFQQQMIQERTGVDMLSSAALSSTVKTW